MKHAQCITPVFFYAWEHLETNRGNLSADGLQIQLKTNTGDEGVGVDA